MDKWHNTYEWDYYSESRPRKVADGIKTKKERGSIGESWWSKRWLRALEELGMGTRLARGRSYARQGQVLSIDIHAGQVTAKVQGSRVTPYKIKIQLQPLSNNEWSQVTEVMASQAIYAAKLLAGEMPPTIEEAFKSIGLSLFPVTEQDLITDCNCPDWANPCKHVAAVYYILAEQFDEDPFLIFALRGCGKDEIINILRQKRAAALPAEPREPIGVLHSAEEAPIRLEDHVETFWQAGEGLDTFAVDLHDARVDKAILKRLGDAPLVIGRQNISVILANIYDVVHEAVLRKTEELQS